MATDKNTLKNWFKTGLKPTQTQFWAWMDSFWHKDEAIPQGSVENLINTLNAKAEKLQLDSHLAQEKETVVTTGGTKIAQPTPTGYLVFTNQTDPTILAGFDNPTNGKSIVIVNKTLQNIPILSENLTATANNRLLNINNQDLFIVVNGSARFDYSASLNRWILINLWATDYFASLIGNNKRAVSVTAAGQALADEIVDLKIWDNARNTAYSKAEINVAYSTLTKGQQLVCPNITGGGITYEKYDDSSNDWIVILTPKLT